MFYQKPPFQKIILSLYILLAIIGSILLAIFDQSISSSFISIRESNPFIMHFSNFFDRSLFDGDGFGGQDPSYLLTLIALLGYILSYIPKVGKKIIPYRKYFGFFILSVLVLFVFNRGFKALFARARPGDVNKGSAIYSAMWTFGNYSFEDAFSKGSFTSGHTNVAIFLLVLAFIALGTKKNWLFFVSFFLTLGYAILMALARTFEGDHYLSDGFWAIIIGLGIIPLIYFKILQIPAQEAGQKLPFNKGEEVVWGILFIIFFISIIAVIISLRYMFIDFQWYLPIIFVSSIVGGYFIGKILIKSIKSKK